MKFFEFAETILELGGAMIWFVLLIVFLAALGFWHHPIFLAGTVALGFLGTSLIIGAPLFWLVIVAESGLLCWCLDDDDDEGILSTLSILLLLCLFQFTGSIPVFTTIWHYPWWTVVALAAYLLIGGLWSIAKWWFAETNKFNKAKESFLNDKHIKGNAIPVEHWQTWVKWVEHLKTDPRAHKNRFLSWIAYWPWSLVWTLINDPLKRACRRIYYELQGVYQRITDHVWQLPEGDIHAKGDYVSQVQEKIHTAADRKAAWRKGGSVGRADDTSEKSPGAHQ